MKYFSTYFRIKSNYNYDNGFAELQDAAAFRDEVAKVFTADGWEIVSDRCSGSAPTAKKAEQELYLHPMCFSGVICDDSIERLHSLLSAPELATFSCYHVDVYEEYKDMTDEEYLALLHDREDEIKAALLDRCRTKRSNLYTTGNIISSVATKFSVRRLGQRPGYDKENLVVGAVFEQLIQTGTIVTANTKSGVGYRTVSKKEGAA